MCEFDHFDYDDEFDVLLYFQNGPQWLFENSSSSRKKIVMSIRKQYKQSAKMSTKQQWVLAYWCANADAKYG